MSEKSVVRLHVHKYADMHDAYELKDGSWHQDSSLKIEGIPIKVPYAISLRIAWRVFQQILYLATRKVSII